jgi:lariat debranching enzyme
VRPAPQVFRLLQLQQPTDVFLSHDWPSNIARYGNLQQLLSRKARHARAP